MAVAKSRADGLPISAIVGTDKHMDASGPNSLAGTYTGSPTACAAALAVFDVIEEEDILGKSHPSQRALHSFRRASPTHALHIIQCDQKTYPPKLYAPFICSEDVLANH